MDVFVAADQNALFRQGRARIGALKRRRPTMPLRRKAGKMTSETVVHRGECEIIARD